MYNLQICMDLLSMGILGLVIGGALGYFFGRYFQKLEIEHPELWEDDSE